MSLSIGVQITGGQQVVSLLNRMVLEAQTKRGLLEELGNTLVAQTQLRFQTQVGPDGVAWKPSIRAQTQGGQTLSDKGLLKGSLTRAVVGEDTVEVGTNLIYAAPNQFGAIIVAKGKALVFKVNGKFVQKKSITLPSRPFLGVNDADQVELEETVGDYVAALVSRVSK